MMGKTIGSEGAWSTITEQTEDVDVEILATAVSGQGLDAEVGARQIEPDVLSPEESEEATAAVRVQSVPRGNQGQAQKLVGEQQTNDAKIQDVQLDNQARGTPRRSIDEEVTTIQQHTAARFTQFWISDVVDTIIDDLVDEMTQPLVPIASAVSLVPQAVAELMEDVVAAAVERAVGATSVEVDPTPPGPPQMPTEPSDQPADVSEQEPQPEQDALSAERLESLRQLAAEPIVTSLHLGDEGDDLLPPLTLDEIDLDASDERRENAAMIREMLGEIADGVERIMEKTAAFLNGTSNGWDTNWHEAADRKGEEEFVTGARHDTQWHGVGVHVHDGSTGMAPMVTVRQVREHRINSIG